jgi:hypothetical protein
VSALPASRATLRPAVAADADESGAPRDAAFAGVRGTQIVADTWVVDSGTLGWGVAESDEAMPALGTMGEYRQPRGCWFPSGIYEATG